MYLFINVLERKYCTNLLRPGSRAALTAVFRSAERGKETELCLKYRLREWNMRGPKYFPAK